MDTDPTSTSTLLWQHSRKRRQSIIDTQNATLLQQQKRQTYTKEEDDVDGRDGHELRGAEARVRARTQRKCASLGEVVDHRTKQQHYGPHIPSMYRRNLFSSPSRRLGDPSHILISYNAPEETERTKPSNATCQVRSSSPTATLRQTSQKTRAQTTISMS